VQSVTLLAVTKHFDAACVRAAYEAGQRQFGENYVAEAVTKIQALAAWRAQLQWHLIGPLQSNKTRIAAEQFDWVHTVDRFKIAERLSQQRPPELAPLQVCLQVNISGEPSKSGADPHDVLALARQVTDLPRLKLRGLMAIPASSEDPASQRAAHRGLRVLLESLQAAGLAVDTLSMGMSGDLEAAIAEGATLVRVGTAIFGARPPR